MGKEIKFMHTGDIHLGMSFANASFGHYIGNKRREEIKETFFKILDKAANDKVNFILIAGDLFEEDYITMSDIKDIQKKFASLADIHILISAGNHDPIIDNRSLYNKVKWSENVHIFSNSLEKYTIPNSNIDIYSFSWDVKLLKSFSFDSFSIDDKERFNILMLHGDIYNKSNYLPLNINELIDKGFDYIALGHIHKPDINEIWAYPGSPEPLDFKETGEHGIIEGIIKDNNLSINFVPIAKREFILKEIYMNDDMTFEELKEELVQVVYNDYKKNGMYKILLKGVKDPEVNINIDILKEILESIIFYCEIIDETQLGYDLERIKMNNKNNLIGEFINYMENKGLDDPQIKDALYEGLGILLSEREG